MSCNSVLVKYQCELTQFYEPVFFEEGSLTDLDDVSVLEPKDKKIKL